MFIHTRGSATKRFGRQKQTFCWGKRGKGGKANQVRQTIEVNIAPCWLPLITFLKPMPLVILIV